jgi:hypothetical protein
MTPKEKAKELVEAMAFSCRECDYESKAKQCALIAVEEILKEYREDYESINKDIYTIYSWWQEVKNEINKI